LPLAIQGSLLLCELFLVLANFKATSNNAFSNLSVGWVCFVKKILFAVVDLLLSFQRTQVAYFGTKECMVLKCRIIVFRPHTVDWELVQADHTQVSLDYWKTRK
jgi:hypothetical protein